MGEFGPTARPRIAVVFEVAGVGPTQRAANRMGSGFTGTTENRFVESGPRMRTRGLPQIKDGAAPIDKGVAKFTMDDPPVRTGGMRSVRPRGSVPRRHIGDPSVRTYDRQGSR